MRRFLLEKFDMLRDLSVIMKIFSAIVIAQYLYFYLQGQIYDGKGLLGQRHLLGAYLIMSTVFVLQFSKWKKLYSVLYVGCILILISTLESRISLIAAVFVIFVFIFLKIPGVLHKRNVILTMIILLLFGLCLYYIRPESVQGRLVLWRIAWSALDIKHLLLGNGASFVEYKIAELQGAYLSGAAIEERLLAGEVKTVMNEYLHLLLEIGVLGCGLLLYIFFNVICSLYKTGYYFLIAGMIGLAILAAASYPFYALPVSLLCMLIVSIAASVNMVPQFSLPYALKKKTAKILMVFILVFIGWISLEEGNYLRYQHKWARLVRTFDYKYNEPVFHKEYSNLTQVLGSEPAFLEDYAVKLQSLSYLEEADAVLQKLISLQPTTRRYLLLGYNYELQQQYVPAEKSYRKAMDILPKSFLPKYLLFDMYRQSGEMESAIDMGIDILKHPVKVRSPKVEEMRTDIIEFLNLNYIIYEED